MRQKQAQERIQQRSQEQKRSEQALQFIQDAVRPSLDAHRKRCEQTDLDALVDELLSEDSDDFLTNFVQSSGE